MHAMFCQAAFDVDFGVVHITMADGRTLMSAFPRAVWKWLSNKNWRSVTVWDDQTGQSYGWDRF